MGCRKEKWGRRVSGAAARTGMYNKKPVNKYIKVDCEECNKTITPRGVLKARQIGVYSRCS